jgi:hypothetical protein
MTDSPWFWHVVHGRDCVQRISCERGINRALPVAPAAARRTGRCPLPAAPAAARCPPHRPLPAARRTGRCPPHRPPDADGARPSEAFRRRWIRRLWRPR